MTRYVLFNKRGGSSEAKLLELIKKLDVRIVDDATAGLFLVEASDEAIRKIARALPDLTVGTEKMHPRPGPSRESIQRSSRGTSKEE